MGNILVTKNYFMSRNFFEVMKPILILSTFYQVLKKYINQSFI